MASGPVLIGIPGEELDSLSREYLAHPSVGGVVLFSRNFSDKVVSIAFKVLEVN